uniref:Sister chromatid cohesion protein DCC1 n=1 Tax=Caenorhabditis tropicalis TaxID=1561998 RepID=A0A1I7TKW2_9PELO
MNRFITKSKPQSKRENVRPSEIPIQNENSNTDTNILTSSTEKLEEPSVMMKLQSAIRNSDAQSVFNMLSKNRPFDNGMHKTMTKLKFSTSYSESSSEYMLLSVDESVVNSLREGQSLSIRGDSSDDAVLCTDEQTFPMKIIESATTILLLHNELGSPDSPLSPNFQVETIDGKCFSSGELCPVVDVLNVGRLKDLLREQELRWDWIDREDDEILKGYKLRDLLNSVQMSVGELKTALADLPVFKFRNGNYRYLSHKYRGEMLGLIVELLDDNTVEDVTLESITFHALRNHFPPNVPDQVIHWFLETRCELTGARNATGDVYRFPDTNLIRDLTVVILYGTQKMPFDEFKVLLTKILPFGVEMNENVFEGVADISDAPFGKLITYLLPEDLPDTVQDRMLFLFDYRKLWTMEQLRPYFKDLYKSKVSFDKFVVQNCEYSLSDSNVMYYCGLR